MGVCVVSMVFWPSRFAGLTWDVVFGKEAGFLVDGVWSSRKIPICFAGMSSRLPYIPSGR